MYVIMAAGDKQIHWTSSHGMIAAGQKGQQARLLVILHVHCTYATIHVPVPQLMVHVHVHVICCVLYVSWQLLVTMMPKAFSQVFPATCTCTCTVHCTCTLLRVLTLQLLRCQCSCPCMPQMACELVLVLPAIGPSYCNCHQSYGFKDAGLP